MKSVLIFISLLSCYLIFCSDTINPITISILEGRLAIWNSVISALSIIYTLHKNHPSPGQKSLLSLHQTIDLVDASKFLKSVYSRACQPMCSRCIRTSQDYRFEFWSLIIPGARLIDLMLNEKAKLMYKISTKLFKHIPVDNPNMELFMYFDEHKKESCTMKLGHSYLNDPAIFDSKSMLAFRLETSEVLIVSSNFVPCIIDPLRRSILNRMVTVNGTIDVGILTKLHIFEGLLDEIHTVTMDADFTLPMKVIINLVLHRQAIPFLSNYYALMDIGMGLFQHFLSLVMHTTLSMHYWTCGHESNQLACLEQVTDLLDSTLSRFLPSSTVKLVSSREIEGKLDPTFDQKLFYDKHEDRLILLSLPKRRSCSSIKISDAAIISSLAYPTIVNQKPTHMDKLNRLTEVLWQRLPMLKPNSSMIVDMLEEKLGPMCSMAAIMLEGSKRFEKKQALLLRTQIEKKFGPVKRSTIVMNPEHGVFLPFLGRPLTGIEKILYVGNAFYCTNIYPMLILELKPMKQDTGRVIFEMEYLSIQPNNELVVAKEPGYRCYKTPCKTFSKR